MKYRKKPVEIEAIQLTTDNVVEVLTFCNRDEIVASNEDGTISIKTLEGVMLASINDYIIRGVKGELYPCKPDIFEATYDKVEDAVALPVDGQLTISFLEPVSNIAEWLQADPQVNLVEVNNERKSVHFEVEYNQELTRRPDLLGSSFTIYEGTTIIREQGIYRTERDYE